MRMVAGKCPNCGAPLDHPAGDERSACDYCGARLHAAVVSRDSMPSSFPREIEELDQEWESYRATWLERKTTGEYDVPDPEDCRMGAWVTGVAAALGLLGCILTGNLRLAIIPIAAGAVMIFVLLRQAKVGSVYVRSLANYRAAREDLLKRYGLMS